MANTGKRVQGPPLANILGLFFLIALIIGLTWLVLSILKGVLSVALTIVCVAIAGYLTWRLIKKARK